MALSGTGSPCHFLKGCSLVTHTDILLDGIEEEHIILKDKSDVVHQHRSGNLFDWHSSY